MRITYWATASLEPDIEAVSKEIFDLADHFRPSRVFSVSPHLRLQVAHGGRVLGFHPLLDPLLRLAIRALESRSDISHVYGEVSPWIYHRTLRRRPIVLTVTSEKGEPVPDFLTRCRAIAVQTAGMQQRLAPFAADGARVELVYPGIDLSAFAPRAPVAPSRRPRILLATFPRAAAELEGRGVWFLLRLAAALPDVQIVLLTRPWRSGESAAPAVRARLREAEIGNVEVLEGAQADMRALYAGVDFTVIPYTSATGGKECPRSLIESMACGVPVLISGPAPFSRFIEANDCGVVFPLDPSGFRVALESALGRYRQLSERAAQCARLHFDVTATRRRYHDIYSAVA